MTGKMNCPKTKIVATVGPASLEVPVLVRLARAGADVFRINFSHGTLEEHRQQLENIRQAGVQIGEPLAIMADLCGPKIRVGKMQEGVSLVEGEEVTIQRDPVVGNAKRFSTTLAELIEEVQPGEQIRLDDGKLRLEATAVRTPDEIVCRIITGGPLSGGKGIHLPQTRLSIAALTEKDFSDARWIAERDFDYVALSFVQGPDSVLELRDFLAKHGSSAKVVAKIEKPNAIRNIGPIIEASDVILVARGDMGVEMDLPEVPLAQKRLAELCRQAGKPCIIATQMLESMTSSPTPTRAEVSDVANAVLDMADAVMLSGETAIGKYPVESVAMMDSIVRRAEQYQEESGRGLTLDLPGGGAAAIAQAVHTVVFAEPVRAVVTFSASGTTAQALSKMRLPVPLLVLTPNRRVLQQACLLYGVQSRPAETPEHTGDVLALAAQTVADLGWAVQGECIIVVSGRPIGRPGSTNTLVVHRL